MDKILELLLILAAGGQLPAGENGFLVAIVFGIAATIVFIGFVLLDVILVLNNIFLGKKKGRTIFDVRLGWRTLGFLITGSIGALFTGVIAYTIGIFQFKIMGALAAGLTWPVVLSQIVEKLKSEVESEEEQVPSNEEKS